MNSIAQKKSNNNNKSDNNNKSIQKMSYKNIQNLAQITNGIQLSNIVNNIFYQGKNQTLQNKIIKHQTQRKGNNIINLNIILKTLKNDFKQEMQKQEEIFKLSAFTMIQQPTKMRMLLDWIFKHSQLSNQSQQLQYQQLSKQQQQHYCFQKIHLKNPYDNEYKELNGLENLYFVSDINKQSQIDLNDSLQRQRQRQRQKEKEIQRQRSGDKVVKKGSFKLIKPKSQFKINSPQKQSLQLKDQNHESPSSVNILKDKILFNMNSVQQITAANSKIDRQSQPSSSSQRKTVPKMMERPPICRQANKQNTKSVQKGKNDKKYENSSITISNNFDKPFRLPVPIPRPTDFSCQSNKSSRSQSAQSNQNYNENQNYNQKVQKTISMKNNLQLHFQQPNSSTKIQQSIINSQLKKDLQNLDKEIIQQQKSIKKFQRSKSSSYMTNHQNSNTSNKKKKIFKIDIKEVNDQQRKEIVQWLISINMLNSKAVCYYSKLHQICKNGVIFPQIINHQKGRGSQISYFKDPKKSAEINSNYQKVFNFLKDYGNFSSQIIFMYEYFIPQAQQKAFWSFMKSIYQCFARLRKLGNDDRDKSILDYQNSIKKKFPKTVGATINTITTPMSNKQKKKNNEIYSVDSLKNNQSNHNNLQYQKIKYGNNYIKNRCQSQQKDSQELNLNQRQKQNRQKKQNSFKRKSSQRKIEFIKQLSYGDTYSMKEKLIQKQQPNQNENENLNEEKMKNGYTSLYQKKINTNISSTNLNKKYDTPKKSTSMINTSMSRSRILSSINMASLKKNQQGIMSIPSIPNINLQMQMKVLQFLKQKPSYQSFFNRQNKQLFKDPLRNGVLLNQILKDQFKILNYTFYQRPKNIQNCRQNYKLAINTIKRRITNLDIGYYYHLQEIIKGDKSLFYGLVYTVIKFCMLQSSGGNNNGKKHPLSMISNQNYSFANSMVSFQNQISRNLSNKNHQNNIKVFSNKEYQQQSQKQKQILLWIRDLQQFSQKISKLKIRDYNTLIKNIIQNNFIYYFVGILLQSSKRNTNQSSLSSQFISQNLGFSIISPNYNHPITQSQQQSNLKKIISYMIQNKYLSCYQSSQLLLKIKKIVKKDNKVLKDLIYQLILISRSKIFNRRENDKVTFVKYMRDNLRDIKKNNQNQRLDTTMANQSLAGYGYGYSNTENNLQYVQSYQNKQQQQNQIKNQNLSTSQQLKWMRKLGFNGDLALNNGVILCRFLQRVTMKTIQGYKQKPQSKAQSLMNIKRALKIVGQQNFKWDQNDIYEANKQTNLDLYKFLKEKYKHSYALKLIHC